jgi:hypothetical protein
LLNSQLLNGSVHKQIIDIVLASKEVDALQKSLVSAGKAAVKELPYVNREIREEFENTLLVPLNYFE